MARKSGKLLQKHVLVVLRGTYECRVWARMHRNILNTTEGKSQERDAQLLR